MYICNKYIYILCIKYKIYKQYVIYINLICEGKEMSDAISFERCKEVRKNSRIEDSDKRLEEMAAERCAHSEIPASRAGQPKLRYQWLVQEVHDEVHERARKLNDRNQTRNQSGRSGHPVADRPGNGLSTCKTVTRF